MAAANLETVKIPEELRFRLAENRRQRQSRKRKRESEIAESNAAGEQVPADRPQCRYHPGVGMELRAAADPFIHSSAANRFQREARRRMSERKIWRCAVNGCPSVAPVLGEDMEELEMAS